MTNKKHISIGVAIALACTAIAYGVGRLQGGARVGEANARTEAAVAASVSAVSSTRVALEVERGKVARLEGRRRLHLAIIALEDRNFGIAEEQLTAARTALSGAAGSDNELKRIHTELDAFKVVATDDIAEQRKKLIDWCRRVDNLIPPS